MSQEMQFETNDDYPTNSTPQNPESFPAPAIDPCARITTRIYNNGIIETVKDCVLVRLFPDDNSISDSSSSTEEDIFMSNRTERSGSVQTISMRELSDRSLLSNFNDFMFSDRNNQHPQFPDGRRQSPINLQEERAYWIQRDIREAIYGRVCLGEVLRRRDNNNPANALSNSEVIEWETTGERCAIKEMSWEMIREQENNITENPLQEVAAMQYLQRYHFGTQDHDKLRGNDESSSGFKAIKQKVMDTHIMMPFDVISDDSYLYSIMPYVDGNELFNYLDKGNKFTERQSRYWMKQILQGVENLHKAGVCHRDISLENILTDSDGRLLIIDMGMSLKIPCKKEIDTEEQLGESFSKMLVDCGACESEESWQHSDFLGKNESQRSTIKPQGACGKLMYMSPEILQNTEPFDGHAIDMWALGVILYAMVVGSAPWKRACNTDKVFRFMSDGCTVSLLTHWGIDLSEDLKDLLQRMFWIDPKDRLSLEQVRAHPWMNGPLEVPPSLLKDR